MESVVITLVNNERSADLELPVDIPLGLLLPPVCTSLGWFNDRLPTQDFLILTGMVQPSGRPVTSGDTLTSVGVRTGDLIMFSLPEPVAEKPEIKVAVKEPSLVSETGEVFPIRGRSIIIGRPDARRRPDIDLTPFDKETVTSRRHAQIWLDHQNNYWIKDLNSTNGLLVNGRFLARGERVRLENGVDIQFGSDGPIMIFRTV